MCNSKKKRKRECCQNGYGHQKEDITSYKYRREYNSGLKKIFFVYLYLKYFNVK
jgi:hypothetical protein